MSTWYKTRWNKIEPVEVERHTAQSVWVGGRRRSRLSWESYFETWELARAHLLIGAERQVLSLRRQLEGAEGALGNIKGWRAPDNGGAERGDR